VYLVEGTPPVSNEGSPRRRVVFYVARIFTCFLFCTGLRRDVLCLLCVAVCVYVVAATSLALSVRLFSFNHVLFHTVYTPTT